MFIRAAAMLLLAGGVWLHAPLIIVLALGIEIANWLYCPENVAPPEWVDRIIDAEFLLLDLEPVGLRYAGIGLLISGHGLLGLGLATHHLATVFVGLLLVGVLSAMLWALSRLS